MYRLMIVDDEHNIVNWISYLLETTKGLDFEIIREYKSSEALDCLQTTKVDLLLTDIQMPGIDGIQLATKAQELWPSTRIVFLTGYHDFEPIYQATKLKHIRYLLKSEDDDIILQTVEECLEELKKEKEGLILQDKIERKLFDLLLQADFFKNLLFGKSVSQVRKQIRKYKIQITVDLDSPVYLVFMKVQMARNFGADLDYTDLCRELPSIVFSVVQENFCFGFIPVDSNSFLWIFQPSITDTDELSSRFSHYVKNCLEEIVSCVRVSLHVLCGSVFIADPVCWEDLYSSYRALEEYYTQKLPQILVQDNFFTTISCVELKQNLSKPDRGTDLLQKEQLVRSLKDELFQCRQEDYFRTLRKLEEMMVQSKSMHDLDVMGIYMDVSSVLLSYISQYHLQEKISMKIAIFPLYYLANFSSWQEAYQYVKDLSVVLFAESLSRDTDSKTILVGAFKKYIADHLEENLNLHTLSEQFNYNSSYISFLFKQITGIGISEYITRRRIDRANELLRCTSDSIAEIASKSGFDTVQYFSYVYKKNTKRTPTEYRLTFRNT